MSDIDPADTRSDIERTGSFPRPDAAAPAPVSAPGGAGRGTPRPDARDGGQDAEPPAPKPVREKSGSDWFAPRKAPTAPPPSGDPAPAASSGGTGSAGFPGTGSGAGSGTGGGSSGPNPSRPDLPYFSGGPQGAGDQGGPRSSDGSGFGADGPAGPGGPRATPGSGVRTPGPSGPTTGPVTGTSSLTPNLDSIPGMGSGPAGVRRPVPGIGPGGPGGTPPRMSDDTAILTPQLSAPEPGHVSGDTLTSGIPVVSPDSRSPFPGGPGAPRPDLGSRPGDGGPLGSGPGGPTAPSGASSPRPSARAAAPAKKGRSKLVLLGVGVVALFGIAYGAGLLMNHSEVPKGTTVLGVDIGGGTKAEAVSTLEATLGKRAKAPLELSVDGKTAKLSPDKAGLSLDSQETVRGAAGSDYNPVSVIGSLFGGERPADPVIPVDEEKLTVALTDLAGTAGSSNDGTIKFEPNKAIAVPGRTGKALDVNQSLISVRDAYRAQVQTGRPSVVELPVTTSEPTITKAELNRAMKDFAEPAMSGLITIKAGPKQIQFGPAKSLPQILSMKAVDGRLVEVYDKKAINTLLDGVFDGIMATKGDGKQHEVNADDVAHAMQSALLGKTPAERTVTIDLEGN